MKDLTFQAVGESDFSAMGAEWNALLALSSNNSVFLTWEWLSSWWQHFRNPGDELAVTCARDPSGKLKCIFPLFLDRDGTRKSGGTLRFLGAGEACSDFLDVIAEGGCEEEVVPQLMHYSLERWPSAMWSLTDVPAGSRNLPLLKSVLRERGIRSCERDGQICPFLELPGSLQDFVKVLKPSMRSNYRRGIKKVAKHFGTACAVVENKDDFRSNLETLVRLHRARFKMKGESSNFLSDKMMRHHLDAGRLFAERGWVRFFTIDAGDKDVGSLYCFVYDGRTYYYQGGFDPDYELLSIGLVLLGKAMEDSVERRVETFEFLRGAEAYKWHWTNTYRKTVGITVYPKNAMGTAKYRWNQLKGLTFDRLKKIVRGSGGGGNDERQFVDFCKTARTEQLGV